MFRTAENNYSSTPSKNWYAIYVRSRHEKYVYSELQQKGIESSLPLVTQTRQWSDRKKKVEVPLFRGYVFVNIDISKDKMNVLQTDGVVKFVTFCNKTVSILSSFVVAPLLNKFSIKNFLPKNLVKNYLCLLFLRTVTNHQILDGTL